MRFHYVLIRHGLMCTLQAGDALIAVDGKLMSPALAQLITHEARHGKPELRAPAATVTVLRVAQTEYANELIERCASGDRTRSLRTSLPPPPLLLASYLGRRRCRC